MIVQVVLRVGKQEDSKVFNSAGRCSTRKGGMKQSDSKFFKDGGRCSSRKEGAIGLLLVGGWGRLL